MLFKQYADVEFTSRAYPLALARGHPRSPLFCCYLAVISLFFHPPRRQKSRISAAKKRLFADKFLYKTANTARLLREASASKDAGIP